MKIVIQENKPDAFLHVLAKTFLSVGDKVTLWNQERVNIYNMISQLQPDLLFISNIEDKHMHLLQNINYISYNEQEISGSQFNIKPSEIQPFADTTYKNTVLINDTYQTDILFSSNFLNNELKLLSVIDDIVNNTDLSVKCIGTSWISNPAFIGFCPLENFINVASSSTIVVTTSEIEKLTLLYNKIYAVLPQELDIKIIKEIKLLRKKTKEARKYILENNLTSMKYMQTLFEELKLNDQLTKLKNMEN